MTDYLGTADPDFWPNLIESLQRAGVTRAEICKLTGVAKSTTSRWANGSDQPRFRRAMILLKLAGSKGVPVTERDRV